MPVFQIAPNQRKTKAHDLKASGYTQIFTRTGRWMKSIDFQNLSSTQKVYLSEKEAPEDNEYVTIFPEQFHSEETNVDGLYAKMETSDMTRAIEVVERWYDPKFLKKQLEEMPALGGMFPVVSLKDLPGFLRERIVSMAKRATEREL